MPLCDGARTAPDERDLDDAGDVWLAPAGNWRDDDAGACARVTIVKCLPERQHGRDRSSGAPESAERPPVPACAAAETRD